MFQNLKQQEVDVAMSLILVTRTSITLGSEPYDPVKSKVRLQLKARDEEKWKPLTKKPLTVVSFDRNDHICCSAKYYGFRNYTIHTES